MMDGPGPSSVATRVMGTGLLENLGCEACWERVGRSERIEAVLLVLCGDFVSLSLTELGLLDGSPFLEDFVSASLTELALLGVSVLAFSDVERVDTEAGFLVGLSERLNESGSADGSEVDFDASEVFLGVRSGTWISFSPVDFLLGGGPSF